MNYRPTSKNGSPRNVRVCRRIRPRTRRGRSAAKAVLTMYIIAFLVALGVLAAINVALLRQV